MLNITNREFSSEIWNQMVIEAANSRKNGVEYKNICRVIYPDSTCTLELKTDRQVREFLKEHGTWNANCGKIPLRELINITRICYLNDSVRSELKEPLSESLCLMASRKEKKFKNKVSKVISTILNFFATDSVRLFGMSNTNVSLQVIQKNNKHKLPFFIGHDANFANWVARGLLSFDFDINNF